MQQALVMLQALPNLPVGIIYVEDMAPKLEKPLLEICAKVMLCFCDLPFHYDC